MPPGFVGSPDPVAGCTCEKTIVVVSFWETPFRIYIPVRRAHQRNRTALEVHARACTGKRSWRSDAFTGDSTASARTPNQYTDRPCTPEATSSEGNLGQDNVMFNNLSSKNRRDPIQEHVDAVR